VNLTGQDEIGRATRKGAREGKPNVHAEAQTFTNAVTIILQTFNKPRDPYRQKRKAESGSAVDYRAYRHIFIEGYRNGDDSGEEERLHVDLVYRVLLWESYDGYEGGERLTFDRLDLPRCKCSYLIDLLMLETTNTM
jgi:hypothetical protein